MDVLACCYLPLLVVFAALVVVLWSVVHHHLTHFSCGRSTGGGAALLLHIGLRQQLSAYLVSVMGCHGKNDVFGVNIHRSGQLAEK